MTERIYCSEVNASEPLCGTADVVDVWLLLEYPAAWGAKALPESALDAATQEWIQACITTLGNRNLRVRPQLIRQSDGAGGGVRLLIGHAGRLLEFRGPDYDFLQGLDLTCLASDDLPEGARLLGEPRYFVCTNGQRDMCCARFGLPIYTSLHERVGARAWQVSHLGGHRFAPNVLVLPEGVLYGRVHPRCLDEFADQVEAGLTAFAYMRGRSCYPKHVQAAEALSGQQDLKLLHVAGDDAAASVTFAGRNQSVRIAVERSAAALNVLSSCGNAETQPVFPYRRR